MCLNSGWTYDRQIMYDQNNLLQKQAPKRFRKTCEEMKNCKS